MSVLSPAQYARALHHTRALASRAVVEREQTLRAELAALRSWEVRDAERSRAHRRDRLRWLESQLQDSAGADAVRKRALEQYPEDRKLGASRLRVAAAEAREWSGKPNSGACGPSGRNGAQ